MINSGKSILIGCLVGIISLATQSIGLTLQRKSHLLEDAKPSSEHHRPPYRRRLWRLGCFLFIMSNVVGSSIQISTLPLIVLSPLQAVGLVFNSICGSLILQEVFTKFTFRGTLLVSIGAFFIAYFGSIPEPNHNLEELLLLLNRRPFLIWFYFSIGLLVSILLYITFLGHIGECDIEESASSCGGYNSINSANNHGCVQETEQVSSCSDYASSETDPLLPTVATKGSNSCATRSFSTICLKLKNTRNFSSILSLANCIKVDNVLFVKGTLYGVVCGILSAHALLLAKSAVELVIIAITEHTLEDLKSYQSWLIISGWIFCAIMQVYYLNLGLKIISSSIMFPLIFCVYNMINILNGLIYFDQLNKLTMLEIGLIITGVCFILCGVFYLSINDIMNGKDGEVGDIVTDSHSNVPRVVVEQQSLEESESQDIFPVDSNLQSFLINTKTTAYDNKHVRPLINTPTSTFSRAHSVYTNSSMNPILSESFDGNKFPTDDNKSHS
ncbi:hypothetical protein DASC09_062160 [Saccharomycopsis crataegensis]|uniref:Uncharacterized protein n=1 Tax=Saccharomycopsis crataegensis TaxID=43959 RepID=A0AAV5QVE7_9ASCO|nr:hypothetical protein DASC09_062160 [Saccharomycopsis crataegensis]